MAVATVADVETSMRRLLTAGEQEWVGGLLERAEARLLARIPDIVKRAGQDAVLRVNVVAVEAEMVARVLRSPNNGVYRTETEGNYSYGLNMAVAGGLLMVLDPEWELLGATSPVEVLAPATDTYLVTRKMSAGVGADWFQTGWPAHDSLSERMNRGGL